MEFNRKLYKGIKKYDREQMEEFFRSVYSSGFQDGVEVGETADFKIKLIQVLKNTKGVGDKIIQNVLVTLKEMED